MKPKTEIAHITTPVAKYTLDFNTGVIEAKPIITRGDVIRAMTDEELAGWLERIRMYCANDLCGQGCPLAEVCYSKADTPLETLDWLKQEAK